jgi:hypothetical protein
MQFEPAYLGTSFKQTGNGNLPVVIYSLTTTGRRLQKPANNQSLLIKEQEFEFTESRNSKSWQ